MQRTTETSGVELARHGAAWSDIDGEYRLTQWTNDGRATTLRLDRRQLQELVEQADALGFYVRPF